LVAVLRAIKAGIKDAAILLLSPAWNIALAVFALVSYLLGFSSQFSAFLFNSIQWPFPSTIFTMLSELGNILLLVVLIRRYARNREEEERLEGELEAARVVQKVLIPDEVPAIPGFAIEAVYKPASQVGGDFFQIVPTNSGGVLMVIGDVSGKGMPAAMTVSLLVGTFRTLAHYTESPTEILRAMNQRMLARSAGGFTTCLALRFEPDGVIVAANAGHLAPYVDGKEFALDNGLPLGLSADATYPEIELRLEHGCHVTLLTDGVPEARNAQGELFGFDRTASIVRGAAQEVAQAAKVFGQSDDVTVVKVTRVHALAFQSD
jgi:serine phosphatase RsbU (regulator of sigma subunit)